MMKLHLLGVNGPFPESRGATSGYLLEVGENLFQFDLGSGVLAALTALTAPESLSALFVSHWHFDHTSDMPVLMYRLQACGVSLPVFGPADPSSGLFRLVASTPCFTFSEVSPGQMVQLCGAEIRVCAARHPVPTVGYRVTFEGKSFGYTGDTNTLSSLVEDYRGCNLLLADGLFPADAWSEEKPHLSAELAARLAADADVGELVVTHLNPFWPRQALLREARAVYPRVRLAEAGALLDL
jgi:ribonuclease BN (tRNA processing enzyme)